MGHDSNFSDSGNDSRASTVVAIARRVPDFAAIVDELLVRICSLQRGWDWSATTIGVPDGHLPSLWSSVFAEAEDWWVDHGLGEATAEQHRSLAQEILSRAPLDAAILLLGVFSAHRVTLLERTDIERIQSCHGLIESTHRSVAQALCLLVLAPWFAERPLEETEQNLITSIGEGSVSLANSMLIACLGLLQIEPLKYAGTIHRVLLRLQDRSRLEEIHQLGGLIERLWPLLPEQVEEWLSNNCHAMPRKVFRLAIERMPVQKRAILTQQWKVRRLARPIPDKA